MVITRLGGLVLYYIDISPTLFYSIYLTVLDLTHALIYVMQSRSRW